MVTTMKLLNTLNFTRVGLLTGGLSSLAAAGVLADQAGRKHAENELHAQPAVRITVGLRDADIIGSDNRALQAAVDYVGNLGGGVVEIGPGEYLMRDSLHLRSRVTVRGAGAKTVLKKDREHRSLLAADGDFGEAAITVQNPEGFAIGRGVYVASKTQRNFLGVCATILNSREQLLHAQPLHERRHPDGRTAASQPRSFRSSAATTWRTPAWRT